MNENKPNAFAFKATIDGEDRLCICPRVNDEWSEKDIIYVKEPIKELFEFLDNKLFSIVFVEYSSDNQGGFWIKHKNSYYLKSDSVESIEMYKGGYFFSTIETGYKTFYEKNTDESDKTSWQGQQISSSK